MCVIGSEEETTGDGAGEMSTGVESVNVVHRRQAAVTRGMVTARWVSSIVFLRPTQVRIGVASYWRRHPMRVYFAPNEYYSSTTPRLFRVADSYFVVLDQYFGNPSSAVIQATGHHLVSF